MTVPAPPKSLLLRSDALEQCRYLDRSRIRVLSVTAQAGSGKTVLISQFDESSDTPFAWVTCSVRHADPRVLFEDIARTLGRSCPDLEDGAIGGIFEQPLSTDELIDLGVHLLRTALETAPAPLTLVIDDAHLLNGHDPSLRLVRRIQDATPRSLRLIVVSRLPLQLEGRALFAPGEQLVVDESILALSREEIASLYCGVFGIPVSTRHIDRLFEMTEGWVAALVLLRNTANPATLKSPAEVRAVGRYFDELTASLAPEQERELLLAASLDGICPDVMGPMLSPSLLDWLDGMASDNLFIRVCTERGRNILRLHHLFQAHLAEKGRAAIPAAEREAYLARCGSAFLDSGEVGIGLEYLVEAGAWGEVEDALKAHGLAMVADNLHWTLHNLLDAVPGPILEASGWLTLIHGIVLLNVRAKDSAESLRRGIRLLRDEGDQAGELIATAMLNTCNVMILGRFERVADLVGRAVELYGMLKERLPSPLVKLVAQSISLGYAYIESDLHRAGRYFELALAHTDGKKAATDPDLLLCRLLLLGLGGDVNGALDALSPFFPLSNDDMISPTVRYWLDIVQANYLLMAGDIAGYRHMRECIGTKWGEKADRSFITVFLVVWDLDMLMAEGRYEQALALARSFDDAHPETIPHMRSQVLHYRMLAAAHMGEREEALRAMRGALRQRAIGGGIWFSLLTRSLVGGALSLLGETRSAERVFHACLKLYGDRGIMHPQIVYAYRAAMRFKNGRREEALRDLDALLKAMQRHRVPHYFGWSPRIMKGLLCEAVGNDVEKDYALGLARSRLDLDMLDDGTPVLLLRVRCAASLKLSLGGKSLSEADLSPTWQKVLRLLSEAPGQVLGVEAIQEELWPGSSPEKTRSKFDTMLSRLRAKIGGAFGEDARQRYLQLHGQKLYLRHCVTDLDRALRHAGQGLEHAARDRYWQAHTAFVHMRDRLGAAYRHPASWAAGQEAREVVIRGLVAWSALLARSNDPKEALEVVDKALALDPINDTAQRRRYDLLTSLKRTGEAWRSVKRYRAALAEAGFDEQEIAQIIDDMFMP
jgi:ATP/maltotriose-dependent transcriptional regulator MalT/DNA-binding SARP family transcriptional activator